MIAKLCKKPIVVHTNMNILFEIITETACSVLTIFYSVAGLFIRLKDSTQGEKNPVILLPGFFCSPLVWLKFRKKLIREGYPVYTPWLSLQLGSYIKNGNKLEKFILERDLKDIYIFAHSVGGIIVTQMGYRGRDRIKKFFAISTPFQGTLVALPLFFLPAGNQLIYRSSFLKNNEINFMTFQSLQCLYSRFDPLIIPGFQGRLGRSDDTQYPGLGHISIIMSGRGTNFIMEKLRFEENKEKRGSAPEKVSGKSSKSKPAEAKPKRKNFLAKLTRATPKVVSQKASPQKKPKKKPVEKPIKKIKEKTEKKIDKRSNTNQSKNQAKKPAKKTTSKTSKKSAPLKKPKTPKPKQIAKKKVKPKSATKKR